MMQVIHSGRTYEQDLFGNIKDVLNPGFQYNNLERNQTDLIFNLQYVSEDDLFSKPSVLQAVFQT